MKRLVASVILSGVAALGAQAETSTAPMDNPSWGYVISGLGDSGRETAYVFTNTTAAMSWTAPLDVASAELLVVGGGGAGGFGMIEKANGGWAMGGGGGGAGGLVHVDAQSITPGGTYEIVVGAGAATIEDEKGGDSSFNDVVAIGGGCGGYISEGFAGGSGGGGSCGPFYSGTDARELTYDGGAATSGQGFGGGYGKNETKNGQVRYGSGGGGGGAGSAGTNVPNNDCGGNGGAGLSLTITGEPVLYAAGGGGGSDGAGNAAGEAGGVGAGRGGQGCAGGDATGYGCGGGGGTVLRDAGSFVGGKGYQGVVIVRVNPTLNAWVEEPGLSATEWIVGQAPEDLAIDFGTALHGESACDMTVEELKALSVGSHEVTFTASEEGCQTITAKVVVKVLAQSVTMSLADGSELVPGKKVVINFSGNEYDDLVLSVAYGRYDKDEDYASDPDDPEDPKNGQYYDPEHEGGWDSFVTIGRIAPGQQSVEYTIPADFGQADDDPKIPEEYRLPKKVMRFFLTPTAQTFMRSYEYIKCSDPTQQYIDTGYAPHVKDLTISFVTLVGTGIAGTLMEVQYADDGQPHMICSVKVAANGTVTGTWRDSNVDATSANTDVKLDETLASGGKWKNLRVQWQGSPRQAKFRVNDYQGKAMTPDPKLDATGSILIRPVVKFSRFSLNDETGSNLRYMQPAEGYDEQGELVVGLYDSYEHKFHPSAGSKALEAEGEIEYRKDQMRGATIRGKSDALTFHVHEWDMSSVTTNVPPTCTTPGTGVVHCGLADCPNPEATREVVLPAFGHHMVFVKDADGKRYTKCANCDYEESEDLAYGTLCDWLENDGAGYLMTDYKPKFQKTKFVLAVKKLDRTKDGQTFLSTKGGTDYVMGPDTGKIKLMYYGPNTKRQNQVSYYNWPYGDGEDTDFGGECAMVDGIPASGAFTLTAFGTTLSSAMGVGTYRKAVGLGDETDRVAPGELVLFCDYRPDKTNPFYQPALAGTRITSLKCYEVENGVETLVHDYVPAQDKDGKAGLWDRVANRFFAPTTDGFTAGRNPGLSIVIW